MKASTIWKRTIFPRPLNLLVFCMVDDRAPTHTCYALKREGKRMSRWLDIGKARLENDTKIIHVSIDRTPVGGFNGYVYLSPIRREAPGTGTAAGSAVWRGFLVGRGTKFQRNFRRDSDRSEGYTGRANLGVKS